jgi:Protein of unknown function (DUF2652)
VITPPRPASGLLLLADISGYTAFLRAVQEAHADDAFADGEVPPAYAFVSSLLDGIIDRLVPPFALGKLEGDAVFVFSTDAAAIPHGASLLACIRGCYATFQDRLAKANEIWTCRCSACMRIDALDLKFVLHAGPFVIQVIGGGEELSGPEVVMAHRLLKNEAAGLVGHGAYALLSEAAAVMLEVDGDGGLRMTETYEHYAPIGTLVFPLR